MKKYIDARLRKIPSHPAGGESYADTIPEMALSTEREGGSPAKKISTVTLISSIELNLKG